MITMKMLLLHILGLSAVIGSRSFVHDNMLIASVPHLIIESSNEFGFSFLGKLPSTENAFISPFSISMILGLLYLGADNTTAIELENLMKYPNIVHPSFSEILKILKSEDGSLARKLDYDLEMANAMLIDNAFNILMRYKDESRKYYDAAVEGVSFSANPQEVLDSINGWVAWKTKDKIAKTLDEPLDSDTKVFLMNAIYFKGSWKSKFPQRYSMPDTFYNDGQVPKTVPMMRQKRTFKYGFDHRIQTHAIELPYEGDHIQMLVLLPEKRDGLSEMESMLTHALIKDITLILRDTPVHLTLPRFTLNEDYDLVTVLKEMGLNSIFDSDTADLSGISPTKGLYVTKALHKCAIEVNEDGSEAAAISVVTAGVRTGGPSVPIFKADHPFMFFIRDVRLDLTLFIGRITKL